MTITTIDAAISAHKSWVSRFKAALANPAHEDFDATKARDCTRCELGLWLETGNASSIITPEFMRAVKSVHSTFHEIAYLIAIMINADSSLNEAAELTIELENLSDQLVKMLELSRRKWISSL